MDNPDRPFWWQLIESLTKGVASVLLPFIFCVVGGAAIGAVTGWIVFGGTAGLTLGGIAGVLLGLGVFWLLSQLTIFDP